MTKYVGKHRKPPKWTPRKTIATTIAASFFSTGSSLLVPKESHDESPLLSLTAQYETPKSTFVVPEPPDPPGNGDDELNAWLAAGGPGYIPDTKDAKGLVTSVAPVAKVAVVQAVCDKPDLPYLSGETLHVYQVVCALFPEITTFGGYRTGDQDHGTGHAIDAMVYGDTDIGNELADWLIAHADELGIKYIIWQQRIWQNVDGLRSWQGMEDRGSPTQNHMDHVHISVN